MNKDCERNVICGDFDDPDPSKWCAVCKGRHFKAKEKRDAKVVDDVRATESIIIASER